MDNIFPEPADEAGDDCWGQFVDTAEAFDWESTTILSLLGAVYKNDAVAKAEGMSHDQRLAYHQLHSEPLMAQLYVLETQLVISDSWTTTLLKNCRMTVRTRKTQASQSQS